MKAYETYGPIEFAQDERFIDWVNHGVDKDSFWENWLQAHPDKKPIILEAQQLVAAIQVKTRTPKPEKIDQIWQAIDHKTKPKRKTAIISRIDRRGVLWLAVAAAGLLLVGFFFNQRNVSGLETVMAERIQHLLPDGTMVYLNAESKLSYREKNWESNRKIYLTGEAFFDVKKGNTFEVITDLGNVKVLGTSFNVRARETFQVACFTGKVEVTPKGSVPIKLLPGDLVYKKNGSRGFDSDTFDPEVNKGWRFGEIDFPAASLEEVFHEIERQYNVEIQIPTDQAHRTYSGKVTMKNLSIALDEVCASMNLKYEKVEKSYRIFE